MRNVITPKPDLVLNNLNDTDSYKFSHALLYPDNMTYMESYLESRGGEFDTCTLFGLQYVLHKYLSKPITFADVDEAERDAFEHGEPFNREGWEHIVISYGGKMPVTIRAIPEGLVVPVKNPLMVIRSAVDPKCFWIVNWLETQLSRVWYSSTIAIASREVKKTWLKYLELSSDDPQAEIAFKHHDFGSRGVTCREQAMLGGAAHLLSFLGSDNLAGIKMANHYYDCKMSGFSIPATEHSTMTVFGRAGEYNALKRWIIKTLVERQVPEGMQKLSACVGDSYDIFNFVRMACSEELKGLIKSSGGTLVVRPDSGDPVPTLLKILGIFEEELGDEITLNKKGYKLLPSYFRIIWGDGINRRSMKPILQALVDNGWSVSNLAMGSGGGLLQDVNRDTQKFAFKCSYAVVNALAVDVSKDPITDPGKKSKQGRLDLAKVGNDYVPVTLDECEEAHPWSVMNTVFDMGDITYHTTLDEVRVRIAV